MPLKRANGTGSIVKLKGRRRKPWRVRVTLGWDMDLENGRSRQKSAILGDFESRTLAEAALADYLKNPYEISSKSITFEQLYSEWSEWYFKVKCTSMTSMRTITAAYAYCTPLYKMRMKDIKAHHLERCIDEAYTVPTSGKDKGKKRPASASTKARMKSLFNLMFDFAVKHEVVVTNFARCFGLSEEVKRDRRIQADIKVPFNYNEITLLWDNVDKIKFVDMILIGIYSGFRPQELSILRLKDVNFETNMFFGGLKTEAGKNRYVPIHSKIRPLVEKCYTDAMELNSDYLFNDAESQTGTNLTYDKYRNRFTKAMSRLKLKHKPHETRHTFITIAKACGMDEHVLKLIVGHSISDITERVYTHRTFSQLEEEMEKFIVAPSVDDVLPYLNVFEDE